MRQICAYEIPCTLKKSFSAELPADLEILTAMLTRGLPVLYGLSDPETKDRRSRTFRIFGSGEEIHESTGIYIGSFIVNGKVPLHLFELEEPRPGISLLRP